jgi:pimeloyl-ACP methyl ester carboxylesterase
VNASAESWKHESIVANGVRLHYVTAGTGPLVVLLHGFPEFWYCWRRLILDLATRFRVVAPDMRGYGASDKPKRVRDYKLDVLSKDVAELIHALGETKAHVVAHDWGGAVAWDTASRRPEVVDRLVVLNAPHPAKFQQGLRTWRQLKKSWYMFAFQLPWFPEWMMTRDRASRVGAIFRGWAIDKSAFTDEDLEKYREAFLEPGAMRAMVNYYRAAFRYPLTARAGVSKKIAAPTLLVWAEQDRALGKELTFGMEPLFSGGFRVHYVPDCSHWVVEEQPALVSRLIREHLSA